MDVERKCTERNKKRYFELMTHMVSISEYKFIKKQVEDVILYSLSPVPRSKKQTNHMGPGSYYGMSTIRQGISRNKGHCLTVLTSTVQEKDLFTTHKNEE